jgi:hypothetical protein
MRAGRQSVGQRQRLAAGVQAYPAFLAVDHNVEIGLVAAGLRHGPSRVPSKFRKKLTPDN